jgi:hypothetical protein
MCRKGPLDVLFANAAIHIAGLWRMAVPTIVKDC